MHVCTDANGFSFWSFLFLKKNHNGKQIPAVQPLDELHFHYKCMLCISLVFLHATILITANGVKGPAFPQLVNGWNFAFTPN